jgi:serine/threonine protein kinase
MCLVTPAYSGSYLSFWMQNESMPWMLGKKVAFHVLRGLAHTHARGIIHGDLKADNVFMSRTQQIPSVTGKAKQPEIDSDKPRSAPSMEDAFRSDYVLADYGSGALTAAISCYPFLTL